MAMALRNNNRNAHRANRHTSPTGNASEANVQPRWLALRQQSRGIVILILILILTSIPRHRGIREVKSTVSRYVKLEGEGWELTSPR
ncbi:hypothetical protein M440DRAFT_1433065 [Trichoderma longibrachiatum ATCC 18648]|uniref:Uncharacterized protein n=1 Tax=Trichoderma longibrachiatum ATCC 18648 TaxID=983965 RepID=A0A2T4BW50_TRILO|nr:hypothetical protein M440DRAFT_1433065 [Trichoderma longibrachiatum ATCC 18648]